LFILSTISLVGSLRSAAAWRLYNINNGRRWRHRHRAALLRGLHHYYPTACRTVAIRARRHGTVSMLLRYCASLVSCRHCSLCAKPSLAGVARPRTRCMRHHASRALRAFLALWQRRCTLYRAAGALLLCVPPSTRDGADGALAAARIYLLPLGVCGLPPACLLPTPCNHAPVLLPHLAYAFHLPAFTAARCPGFLRCRPVPRSCADHLAFNIARHVVPLKAAYIAAGAFQFCSCCLPAATFYSCRAPPFTPAVPYSYSYLALISAV